MFYKPQNYSLVSGVGKSKHKLSAFDDALRKAGIGDYNLVKVSSILPSGCRYCSEIPEGDGRMLLAAYSTITISAGEKAETAVAVAVPQSINDSGVIFETSLLNSNQQAVNIVQEMCTEAMIKRNKNAKSIKCSSQQISGEDGIFVSAISAVVMW